jgi:hypothetical protein
MVEMSHSIPEPDSFAQHCRRYPHGAWAMLTKQPGF